MARKKAIKIVIIMLLLWIGIFVIDWFTIACLEHSPIFCIKNKDKTHFSGLGYSYDAYPHPISGEFEYCLYVFGFETKSTFTNEVSPIINSNTNSDLYE
ncbi:MAG: hypothetical protein K2G88_05455 [Oscillospiraceae bacterium]|nr:hypothetical protein [Oscillospiraceae bacterium]